MLKYKRLYYTRAGDKGTSGLIGGERVPKNDPRLEAYGTIDELNSLLGFAHSFCKRKEVRRAIEEVMNDLFTVGAELASLTKKKSKTDIPRITPLNTEKIEKTIDSLAKKLPYQKSFLLPLGSKSGGILHFSRAVARRAERKIVSIPKKYKLNPEVLKYVNRLSSLLYILARYENKGFKERAPVYKKAL